MAIVAGIDEAGLGPVLGPMVVSATMFELPDESAGESLWRLLAGAVSKKPSKRKPAIAIGDSKKLYGGLRGGSSLEHLERGVLAMLQDLGKSPKSLLELMDAVCPRTRKDSAGYPWYAGADISLPHALTPTSLSLSANALSAQLAAAGIRPIRMQSEVILEGEFNRLVTATKNKSATLFDVTARLLASLVRGIPAGRTAIHLDRQGGRMHYLDGLQRVFDGRKFKILDESETYSGYLMDDGDRQVEFHFRVGSEDQQLPVALASMLSKYIRELFMAVFNRFWAGHKPDIAPTAGYAVDGERFFREVLPHVERLGIDKNLLYRSR
jgi:hypothetical protein